MFLVSSCSCFAPSIETKCITFIEQKPIFVENKDVVGAAPMLQLHMSEQQFHCLPKVRLISEVWRYTSSCNNATEQ